MTIEQTISLIGQLAWPVVALVALFVLLPYVSQLTRAAADLRDLLNRSGEMVDLAKQLSVLAQQLSALNEATSDIKAMQQVAHAARPDVPPAAEPADVGRLWSELEGQWQQTREAFRSVAQSAGVPVNFIGTVGVRDAAKALVAKGIISEPTATAMTDLSAQYQYMYRTTTERSEYLNENVIAQYARTAEWVRQALKSGQ